MRYAPTRFQIHLTALLAALLLAACAATPEPPRPDTFSRETSDLGEITGEVARWTDTLGPERVLVVYDLDNTLLAMEQDLGSDQWYEWQSELAKGAECVPERLGDRLAVQGALYFASAMRPTQPDAARQLEAVQATGATAIALTSRGAGYRLQTFRELRRNGFDFRASALAPAHGWPDEFVPDNGIRPTRYEDGVYLTAGQHKGKMLAALLEKTGAERPALVVMADDKQRNLDDVLETMGEWGVPVHAWRYAGEDARVAAFDEHAAAEGWHAVEDALRTLQRAFGPDHYNLPPSLVPEPCRP